MLYESEYYGIQNIPDERYLEHHGIKGQKWGVRRFQNADGSLTAAGKERYGNLVKDAYGSLRAGNYSKSAKLYLESGKLSGRSEQDAYKDMLDGAERLRNEADKLKKSARDTSRPLNFRLEDALHALYYLDGANDYEKVADEIKNKSKRSS